MSYISETIKQKTVKLLKKISFAVFDNLLSFENLAKQKITGRPFMNTVYFLTFDAISVFCQVAL